MIITLLLINFFFCNAETFTFSIGNSMKEMNKINEFYFGGLGDFKMKITVCKDHKALK